MVFYPSSLTGNDLKRAGSNLENDTERNAQEREDSEDSKEFEERARDRGDGLEPERGRFVEAGRGIFLKD